jgi:hypothetical protein
VGTISVKILFAPKFIIHPRNIKIIYWTIVSFSRCAMRISPLCRLFFFFWKISAENAQNPFTGKFRGTETWNLMLLQWRHLSRLESGRKLMGREVNVDGLLILQPVREEIQPARSGRHYLMPEKLTCSVRALMWCPLEELHQPSEFLNPQTQWTLMELKFSQRWLWRLRSYMSCDAA